jgi:hypothetical protein
LIGIFPFDKAGFGDHFPRGGEAPFWTYSPPELAVEGALLYSPPDKPGHPDPGHKARIAEAAGMGNVARLQVRSCTLQICLHEMLSSIIL